MTVKSKFSSSEWRTLQFAPFWVFGAVAGADRKVDKKEIKAFTKELQEALLYNDPLVREVLISVVTDLENIMQQFARDSRDVLTGLRDVAYVLDESASPEQCDKFTRAMVIIGGQIAKASGKGIFGRKDAVSDQEKAALLMITAALRSPS